MTNSDVPSAGLYPSGVLLLAESAPVHLSRLIDRAKSQGQDLIERLSCYDSEPTTIDHIRSWRTL